MGSCRGAGETLVPMSRHSYDSCFSSSSYCHVQLSEVCASLGHADAAFVTAALRGPVSALRGAQKYVSQVKRFRMSLNPKP